MPILTSSSKGFPEGAQMVQEARILPAYLQVVTNELPTHFRVHSLGVTW